MRVVELNETLLRIPDGWTAFLYQGRVYLVNDEGEVRIVTDMRGDIIAHTRTIEHQDDYEARRLADETQQE